MSARSWRRLLRALHAFILIGIVGCFVGSPTALANPTYRGLNLHSLWSDVPLSGIDPELKLTQDLGANVVRVDVGWSSLETDGKGVYSQWYVDKLDRLVEQANARGMKVIATVWTTPCWASSAPDSVKQGCVGSWWDRGVVQYPPTNPTDYGDIAKWVTHRYGTKLAALEVWNEPNQPPQSFWNTPDQAGDYAKLLKAAYPAAKSGNPDVPVLAGSLSDSDRPFLEKLYADGIKGFYDGLSIHPYNGPWDPSDFQENREYSMLPGLKWIHEGQLAAGDTTPIWATELGWTTCSGAYRCVSEAQQADYTARAVGLLANVPYLAGYALYQLRNDGTSSSINDNYGVVRHDYSPKPAYSALQAAWTGATTAPLPPPVPVRAPAGGPGPQVGPPSTGGGAPVSRPPAQRRRPHVDRIRLRVSRHDGTFVLKGVGPRRSVITLRLLGCQWSSCRLTVRVGSNGRFQRGLGPVWMLASVRIQARVVGSHPSVTAAATLR